MNGSNCPQGIAAATIRDVLNGRGQRVQRHPGNMYYRKLVFVNKGLYAKCPRTDKIKISKGIVAAVRELGGRFLELDERQGLYFDIGDKKATEKTSQALREGQTKVRKDMHSHENNLVGFGSSYDTSLLTSPIESAGAAAAAIAFNPNRNSNSDKNTGGLNIKEISQEGYFGFSVQVLDKLYNSELCVEQGESEQNTMSSPPSPPKPLAQPPISMSLTGQIYSPDIPNRGPTASCSHSDPTLLSKQSRRPTLTRQTGWLSPPPSKRTPQHRTNPLPPTQELLDSTWELSSCSGKFSATSKYSITSFNTDEIRELIIKTEEERSQLERMDIDNDILEDGTTSLGIKQLEFNLSSAYDGDTGLTGLTESYRSHPSNCSLMIASFESLSHGEMNSLNSEMSSQISSLSAQRQPRQLPDSSLCRDNGACPTFGAVRPAISETPLSSPITSGSNGIALRGSLLRSEENLDMNALESFHHCNSGVDLYVRRPTLQRAFGRTNIYQN